MLYQMKITFEDPRLPTEFIVFEAEDESDVHEYGATLGAARYESEQCGVLVRILRFDKVGQLDRDKTGLVKRLQQTTEILRRFWDTTTEGKE